MRKFLPVALASVAVAICAAIVARVVANHALPIQVVGTGAGAALTVVGTAVAASMWPGRDHSELHRLLASLGFFSACVGILAMGAGVGVFH